MAYEISDLSSLGLSADSADNLDLGGLMNSDQVSALLDDSPVSSDMGCLLLGSA